MEEQISDIHIKEYIVNSRKTGYPDSAIIESLRKSNWPEDIIQSAIKEADNIVNANAEPMPQAENQPDVQPEPQKTSQQTQPITDKNPKNEQKPLEKNSTQSANTENQLSDAKKPETADSPVKEDLFTKPPKEVMGETGQQSNPQKPKKKSFSILAIVSLIFSPIPVFGLIVAMACYENMKKNNKSGAFLAFFAILINAASILFVLWLMFQIFTLDPARLTGFSKFVNDKFHII
jgi:hypothetical protein